MTWFRREPEIYWLQGFGDDPAIQEQAFVYLRDAGLTDSGQPGTVCPQC